MIICAFLHFKNPFIVFSILFGNNSKLYTIRLKNGLAIKVRSSKGVAVADVDILVEHLLFDQYQLKNYIASSSVVLDIGGQIGIFSLLASKYNPSATIYVFEAEESNFNLLKQNIEMNSDLSIKIYRNIVGKQDGKELLYVSSNNVGAHTVYSKGERYQEVESVSLNYIISTIISQPVDILKIDCEGSEYDIILPVDDQILKQIRIFLMEVHETEYTDQYSADDLYRKLSDIGFSTTILKKFEYKDEGTFYISVTK